MTAVADAPRARLDRAKTANDHVAVGVMVVVASILAFGLYWAQLVAVWHSGTFFDTDDALRMVQVRGLLAGQHWYDLTVYGLDPPAGIYMHWSRTVDVPIALMIKVFGLFADQATAEKLARLGLPFLCLLGLFSGVAWLADTLFGRVARVPAIAATLLNGAAIVQFQPGRIDHHAPQIVTLVFLVGAAILALDLPKARYAVLTGILIAVSFSISLENLPFIACLLGMLVAVWVWHGAAMDRMLRCLCAGLAAGLIPMFAATVAPDRWFSPVCDAFGAAHLGAGLIFAGGCAVLVMASARMPSRGLRLVGASVVALIALGFVATAYPTCLHDPFAMVDPLVRELWLSQVSESKPLLALAHATPMTTLLYIVPPTLGLAGIAIALIFGRGVAALRMILLVALIAIGIAMTFWQIRVLNSVMPLAVCGALPLAVALHARATRQGRELLAGLALGLVFPFTAMAWAIALPDDSAPAARAGTDTCLAAAAFDGLRDLPPGSVVAPVDAGSFLLVHTGLTAFAGPYHRDNDGNRFMFDAFLAAPDAAYRLLAARDATYLMTCPSLGQTKSLAARAPNSLAAALEAGRIPPWLEPVMVKNTPYTVYRIRHDKN
ncbi:hypothetical protein [Beijerinckia sp. L45]|uniref:hypothetical protein n=1 Tax=Beijerinckia sp. L45 TaxID=1641855 RepID=UPI00131C77A4|nr:hypothetical protein [Beijerinckia sp. L45]